MKLKVNLVLSPLTRVQGTAGVHCTAVGDRYSHCQWSLLWSLLVCDCMATKCYNNSRSQRHSTILGSFPGLHAQLLSFAVRAFRTASDKSCAWRPENEAIVPIIIVVLPQSVHGVLHSLARANSALQTNIANNSVTMSR